MANGRQRSPSAGSQSPVPQPMSKRDVRRKRIIERLDRMMVTFNSNQHQHYRAQLQAVQTDMTLVLRADPYNGEPLEDDGTAITQMIKDLGANVQGDAAAREDFDALAGVKYREFVREVNDQIESRDAELTMLRNNYDNSVTELERLTQQKVHQAHEEHNALQNSLRNRLQTTLSKKRQNMMRDKESLDVTDSNALLLHPDHFTINNNPGSPGNGQNRKTRHLRHRAGSPVDGEASKKKRRIGNAEEDDNQSPAPAFRLPPPDALGGGRSPFKDARDKNAYIQYEAPAYSLERLFTDKELAMASDQAKMATYQHFHQPRPDHTTQTNGTGVPSVDDDNNTLDTAEDAEDPTTTTTAPIDGLINGSPIPGQLPVAPEMERTTSHQVLTRTSARANPLAGLTDLANAAAASTIPTINAVRDNPFAPVIPTFHAVTRSEKLGAPMPPSVSAFDIDNDIAMMSRRDPPGTTSKAPTNPTTSAAVPNEPPPNNPTTTDPTLQDPAPTSSASHMRRALLARAVSPSSNHQQTSQPYRLPLADFGPATHLPKGVERFIHNNYAPQAEVNANQKLRGDLELVVQGREEKWGGIAGVGVRGGVGGEVRGSGTGGGAGGAMSAALNGRLAGTGGEPMSRTTSAGGGSEVEGLGVGVGGSARKGRGRAPRVLGEI